MQGQMHVAAAKLRLGIAALLIALTFGLALPHCSPARAAATEGTTDSTLSPKSEQGLTLETAIPMPAYKSSLEGIAAENDYIARTYPGWKKLSQSLVHNGDHFYDVIELKGPAGERKDIYFDITNWFGADLTP
jgi:hypothetical protein